MILIMVHFYSACFMALDIYNEKQHPCGLHVRIYIYCSKHKCLLVLSHTHRGMHAHTCMRMHARTHTCTHACMHVCSAYLHAHAHMHTHTPQCQMVGGGR